MKNVFLTAVFLSFAVCAGAAGISVKPDPKNLYPDGFGTIVPNALTKCVHNKSRKIDWQCLSPLDTKGKWNFKIMHKDKPSEINDVVGLIEYTTTINTQAYYFYSVPLENKGNLVRFTPEGSFIRNLKYPVFSFIFLDVILEPEIQYLKFPMVPGDEWRVDSTGYIDVLLIFRIKQKTTSTFRVTGEADVPVNGRMVHAYKTTNLIESGDRKPFLEEDWFAEGIGLMYQNTETYVLELQSYEPGPENIESFNRLTVPLDPAVK